MDNKILIIVIAIIVVVIVAFGGAWYFMNMPTATEQDNQTLTPTPTPDVTSEELIVILGEQNSSGVSGRATLTEMGQSVKVVINLDGSPADIVEPAHIHLNNCEDIGGIKYSLTFPVNGYSETIIDTTIEEILSSLPLSLNIHKSVPEMSTYIACGNIIAPQ